MLAINYCKGNKPFASSPFLPKAGKRLTGYTIVSQTSKELVAVHVEIQSPLFHSPRHIVIAPQA